MIRYDSEFSLRMHVVRNGREVPCDFNVVVLYSSDSIDKFRVSGGQKIMEFEKHLYKKRSPWKVTYLNFEFDELDLNAMQRLHYMWDLIDEKRYGKRLTTYYRKSMRVGE